MLYSKHKKITCIACVVLALLAFRAGNVTAQGQDGTPAERDIMILGEMLPGRYDNGNQAYFDVRRKLPEQRRHERWHLKVERLDAPTFGDHVYSSVHFAKGAAEASLNQLYVFEVDNDAEAVRMKTYALKQAPKNKLKKKAATYIEGCDLLWRQEAGQFRGRLKTPDCQLGKGNGGSDTAYDMQLAEDALWLRTGGYTEHHKLDRARNFSCYIDVPGVGGGRDIPYKRYQIDTIHDKGGKAWVTTAEGVETGVRLQVVRWPMNNYKNIFARPSFVMYVDQRKDGETKEISYTWTEPSAQRIGMNLKWMLVNCYMQSNEDVKPFFKEEPKL